MFQHLGLEHLEYHSSVAKELQKLLKIPIDSYNDILVILKLKHYAGKMFNRCKYAFLLELKKVSFLFDLLSMIFLVFIGI